MRRLIAIACVIAVFPAAPATADPTLYGEAKDYRVTVLGSWREQPMRGVVPWVDSHFRTLPGRPHRAIAGASSGAFSALHLTARNPDRFVAAASLTFRNWQALSDCVRVAAGCEVDLSYMGTWSDGHPAVPAVVTDDPAGLPA